ncbi:hypothetical protein [Prevotella multiformis]|nr:hypothetical protein [Prevotella multiformis]
MRKLCIVSKESRELKSSLIIAHHHLSSPITAYHRPSPLIIAY